MIKEKPQEGFANVPPPVAPAPTKRLPAWVYEVGGALAVGWGFYIATGDWKQGVGAGLATMFGGIVHRGGGYMEGR